jgi:hypothetical protein
MPLGSTEERAAVKLANRFSSRKDHEIYSKPTDVSFDVRTSEHVMLGDDFNVELFVKNTSKEARTVQVNIATKVCFYTGKTAKDLKDLNQEFIIVGEECKSFLVKFYQ